LILAIRRTICFSLDVSQQDLSENYRQTHNVNVVCSSGSVRNRHEIFDAVAVATHLSEDQMKEVISSGQQRYKNRIGWALTYLLKASAVARPTRAQYQITDIGQRLLIDHPERMRLQDFRAIDGFREAWTSYDSPATSGQDATNLDPFELVERGVAQINGEIADELIRRLLAKNSAFFEQAVIDLVVAMGYGGADSAATRTQLSNDGGIDGIFDQDVLGLNRVYVQAKRYSLDISIVRPDMQSFVGVLQGQQANHGVFIPTSKFSSGAIEYVRALPTRIVLIDGAKLAKLMIQYRVGVHVQESIHIVEIDEDFFE
jgi:restriction system protein